MQELESHFHSYMNENLTLSKSSKDLVDLHMEDLEVCSYALASDEKGALLKRQAVSYMKDYYGISFVQSLLPTLESMQNKDILEQDITNQRISNQSALDQVEIPPKKNDNDEWEEVELNNPADAVNQSRGVLTFVLPDQVEISSMAIQKSNYISSRSIVETGDGLCNREDLSATDELIFHEYLLQKLGNFTDVKQDSLLQYQLEYVVCGKSSDIENLKSIANRLLLLRESANCAYLFKDAAKVAEAEALAITIASAVCLPEIAEMVKISLLFAWAYAESVYDVRNLLLGKKVPFMKNAKNWHYSLTGMFDYASDTSEAEIDEGVSYKEYLRLFLTLTDKKTCALRSMDIMEMDIRQTEHNEGFCMDHCIDYLMMQVKAGSRYGNSYCIKREYYYL